VTDQKLLELAAKAAGITGAYNDEYRSFWIADSLCGDEDEARAARNNLGLAHGRIWWDPLKDDGDALRLAVKLRLQITPGTYNKDEFSAFHSGRGEAHEHWSTMQDEYAATRRAIVRAAVSSVQ
jgi:hypothetical protein